ncbi:DegT/DnrJ/EryC1/StrS family aminotransferase [Leptospira kobayashii]|nr:DegT/DnrJ/EryC1/StrS aminotransferase family protein [Leptospira kobayashii]
MKNAFLNEVETKKALADFILNAPRLSMDIKCLEFEKKFSLFQKRKEAILFNSGGSANLAIMQALKNLGRLKDKDKVGFSALTWSTNVMPILQLGFEPVAVDCSVKTLNVMVESLDRVHKKEKLKAFFLTNVLGLVGDLNLIKEYCEKENIILIEDNCEALGTEIPSGKAGNFSVASSFSFFVAHHMSTIEGGMVCTDDTELAIMLRIVRANGWDRNLTSHQQIDIRRKYDISNEFEAKYTFYDLGYNLRPTEITGFLGTYQLQFLDENIKTREKNFLHFEEIIKTNPDFLPVEHSHISLLSSFAIPIVCKTPELREKYIAQFTGGGIEIRPMIAGNIQRQPFYHKYVKNRMELPETEFLHFNSFYCGNYPELTEIEIEAISSCLTNY